MRNVVDASRVPRRQLPPSKAQGGEYQRSPSQQATRGSTSLREERGRHHPRGTCLPYSAGATLYFSESTISSEDGTCRSFSTPHALHIPPVPLSSPGLPSQGSSNRAAGFPQSCMHPQSRASLLTLLTGRRFAMSRKKRLHPFPSPLPLSSPLQGEMTRAGLF
jgi:hypothetical protein